MKHRPAARPSVVSPAPAARARPLARKTLSRAIAAWLLLLAGSAPVAFAEDAAAADVVPPLKDRKADDAAPRIVVRGFTVSGVGNHPELGITPALIQSQADAEFAAAVAAAGDQPVKFSFADMQAIVDRISNRYKAAGFILSRAFLPAQSIGEDKIVRIDVLEGHLSKVIVKGNKRYGANVIASPTQRLIGKPLIEDEVKTALLYADDLPGVSVSSTLQPGQNPGETELELRATEDKRPLQYSLGFSNFGTRFTGRYRATAGVQWNSPLGFGDTFNALFEYGIYPENNYFGSASYRLPISEVRGLGTVVGYTRNQLQINSGTFAGLGINGPSSTYYGGAEWKFINTPDLKVTGNLLFNYESSKLSDATSLISNDRFSLVTGKVVANRTDKVFKGVDVFEFGFRKSIDDRSVETDSRPPADTAFIIGTVSYTRLQFLTKSQRLIFKVNGQYTRDALIPIEQFAIGGPESVRAYPVVEVLGDRGVFTSLEYHVNAPGFGDAISPFYGRPWKEILEFEIFTDFARAEQAGQHRGSGNDASSRSGIGTGVLFRLPRFYQMQLHLSGAVPLSNAEASDQNDYHIYGQIGFSF